MRIDWNAKTPPASNADEPARSNLGAAQPASGHMPAKLDAAQFSFDPSRVASLEARVNSLPEIRQEKVEALGRALREGSYQVSAEQTAEGLLAEIMPRSFQGA